MKASIIAIGLLISINFLYSQEEKSVKTLTLSEAVSTAFQQHPILKSSEYLVDAARFKVQQVKSGYFPQLIFNTSYTRWDWILPNKRIFLGNSLDDIYAEFSLQQLIYSGGKTSLQYDIAQNNVSLESLNNRRLQQSIAFSVTRSYLLLLKAERLVKVQEFAVANLREHAAMANLLYQSGKVSQLDVLKAQTQLALANEELVKAQNAVTIRRHELLGAMGIDSTFAFQTVDFVESLWEHEKEKMYNEDSLLTILEYHPDLEKARVDAQGKEVEVSLAGSDYYPTVFLKGIYNWESSQIPPGHKNWNVGIGLSFPIYQGWATSSAVQQAQARFQASSSTVQAVRQKLIVAIRSSLINIYDTRSRVKSAKETMQLAEETEKVANLKYRTGKGTSLDVLDAELLLTNSRINYTQVLTDYAIAVAELYYNIGSSELPFKE